MTPSQSPHSNRALKSRSRAPTNLSIRGLLDALGLLLGLLSVAALLGRLFWWLAPWWLDLVSHFVVQYAVVLVAMAFGCLVIGAPRKAMLLAACSLPNLTAILPHATFDNPALDQAQAVLRLVFINVHTENARSDQVIALVDTEKPDIVVLTEVDARWMEELKPLSAGYPHRIEAPQEDNFGIALWSRIPVARGEVVWFGEAGVPSIEADFLHRDRLITLIGTHPVPPVGPAESRLRDRQLAAISARTILLERPVVVMGDLNTTPWAPSYRRFCSGGRVKDTFGARGLQATWPASLRILGIPLDHCLVSAEFRLVDRRLGPTVGSDHRPLIVDLAWR